MEFRELESKLLECIKYIASVAESATNATQVINAVQYFASFIFSSDTDFISGCQNTEIGSSASKGSDNIISHVKPFSLAETIDKNNEKQDLVFHELKNTRQEELRHVFYAGVCFSSLANILLFKIASNWLACFSSYARTSIYDIFFLNAPASEAIQVLMPALECYRNYGKSKDIDVYSVCLNAERLLVLFLIECNGIKRLLLDFEMLNLGEKASFQMRNVEHILRISQLLSAIPDKARLQAPESLSASQFFREVTRQLLAAAEKRWKDVPENVEDKISNDQTFTFIGAMFSRVSRRGHADIIVSEVIPKLHKHVENYHCLERCASGNESVCTNRSKSYWEVIISSIKDIHALEKWSEALLRKMAMINVDDLEVYWMLWALFHAKMNSDITLRTIFTEKFLLWKVFPLNCLRWILQFTVFCCPPSSESRLEEQTDRVRIDIVSHLVDVWSKREFIQETSMEQQTYITAAIGLSLQKMSKKHFDASTRLLHLLIQGVSCRLDSPNTPVRKMASSIALIFSKLIDAKNPLLLDDEMADQEIDWSFGVTRNQGDVKSLNHHLLVNDDTALKERQSIDEFNSVPTTETKSRSCNVNGVTHVGKSSPTRRGMSKLLEHTADDPDEVIDPAFLNRENFSDEDDTESIASDNPSESSLVPYDMTDDESDLRQEKLPSQLSDCLVALRKSDDPDAVEHALDVCEQLVRALPDELDLFAEDLVQALVHVRCSDVVVEGEEDSANEKRHHSLVALLATCPLKSVGALTKLLYSPHVDISQRLLILEVMADAAKELSHSRNISNENSFKAVNKYLITEVGRNPWYLPSSQKFPLGAGPWKEVSNSRMLINWSNVYEREIPSRPQDKKVGKSQRWGHYSSKLRERRMSNHEDCSINKFPPYAAAFMLPVMHGYDKRRHGVDLLGRDFIVLGKLIYMLGICMECVSSHPEAFTLACPLLDLLSSRDVSHHPESYVRISALFAASRTLMSLNPSYIAMAFTEGNHDIIRLLEWVRNWALEIAENDVDHDCSVMATACLQLHSEIALQSVRLMKPVGDKVVGIGKASYNIPNRTILLPNFTNN